MVVFNFKDFDNTVQKTKITKNFSCPFCYYLCGSFQGLQLHLNSFHKLLDYEFLTSEENQTVNVSVRPNTFGEQNEGQGNHRENFDPLSIWYFSDSDSSHESETGNLSDGPSEAGRTSLLETRQFYHSRTLQPMTLEEVMSDRDSEDEVDEEDTDFQDHHIIHASEDVSLTEANFTNLWNSFVREQRVVPDIVPWACRSFSKFHKKEFIESKPLHSCWRMFLLKLWDYGLIDGVTINRCNLIIEDNEYDPSDNTNNNNSVNPGIDLNRNNTTDVDNNEVDRGIDLESNNTMDVNNNNVDRGIDLTGNVTVDVNNNSVDRGMDLNRNVVVDVDEDVNENEDK